MKKNWMELHGEKVRKRKEGIEKVKEKYWKLPAVERLHYDSISEKIENNWSFLHLSIYWLKMCVVVPIILVVIGFFTGTLESLFASASMITISFVKIFPLILFLDLIVAILYSFVVNPDSFEELNKRFKLIK